MQALSDLLTIVIPVKNEEKNLPACLENVKDFRYVVLVDSGSADKTRDIFEGFKFQGPSEKVSGEREQRGWDWLDFKWDGKFPKKRNWVLRNYQFKTPWALFLDADERITPAFCAEAEKTLSETKCNAFICYYDNWFMGRMLRHGDVMHKTAILRLGTGEYEKIDEHGWSSLDMEIHEHLQVEGEIGVIKSRLEHHDKRSLESYYKKHEEYANWEANRYKALKGDFSKLTKRQQTKYGLIRKWWFGFAYFCACYFFKLGILDGKPGFVFARGKWKYFSNIRRKINHEIH